jgi:hypothetical protein
MHRLIDTLAKAIEAMDEGRLGTEALEQATDDARALYERLVVLRHKAREGKLVTTPFVAEPVPPPAELPAMKLETRPVEPPVRQTSLIDAIAETEVPAPAPPEVIPMPVQPPVQKPKAPKAQPKQEAKAASLGDRLEHAPIPDLHKAIALSQKFWFVAELFNGQRDRYERTIDGVNAAKSLDEARALLAQEVNAKSGKAPDPEALAALNELLDRRFQ